MHSSVLAEDANQDESVGSVFVRRLTLSDLDSKWVASSLNELLGTPMDQRPRVFRLRFFSSAMTSLLLRGPSGIERFMCTNGALVFGYLAEMLRLPGSCLSLVERLNAKRRAIAASAGRIDLSEFKYDYLLEETTKSIIHFGAVVHSFVGRPTKFGVDLAKNAEELCLPSNQHVFLNLMLIANVFEVECETHRPL